MVRFQVNVQFCLQECLPVNCDNSRHVDSDLLKNSQSWGRRRRRRSLPTVMDDGKFRTNNTELHREIIVESVSRQSMKNKENSERLKSSDRERHHQEDGDEEREHQTPMYCASKISVIIGFITMFMIQVSVFREKNFQFLNQKFKNFFPTFFLLFVLLDHIHRFNYGLLYHL